MTRESVVVLGSPCPAVGVRSEDTVARRPCLRLRRLAYTSHGIARRPLVILTCGLVWLSPHWAEGLSALLKVICKEGAEARLSL